MLEDFAYTWNDIRAIYPDHRHTASVLQTCTSDVSVSIRTQCCRSCNRRLLRYSSTRTGTAGVAVTRARLDQQPIFLRAVCLLIVKAKAIRDFQELLDSRLKVRV
jgi:hypothetical protein